MSDYIGQLNDSLSQDFLNEPSKISSDRLAHQSRATQNTLVSISKLKQHEIMQHRQIKTDLETQRYFMAAALAACTRYKVLVSYNYELSKRLKSQSLYSSQPEVQAIDFPSQYVQKSTEQLVQDLRHTQLETEKR